MPVNAFPPIVVAAALDLSPLDLDGMGRACPRLDHTLLHARGAPVGPCRARRRSGELVVIDVPGAVRAEALARASLAALGGWSGHAGYPRSPRRRAAPCTARWRAPSPWGRRPMVILRRRARNLG